ADIRGQELDGFADGLFGAEQELGLPERAHEALDRLAELRVLFASVRQLATEDLEATPTTLGETFRNVLNLTGIAEREIHEAVIACTKARQQTPRLVSRNRRQLH